METKTQLSDETMTELNRLIQINADSEAVFRDAVQIVEDPDLAQLFLGKAAERAGFGFELGAFVRTSGGETTDRRSVAGTLHKWWLDVRARLQDDKGLAVLSELERSEDRIMHTYEKVLVTIAGNPVSDILHQQMKSIRSSHDRIRDLRDSLRATA